MQIWRRFEDTPGRIHLMDELRGLSVLALIIYHGCYDLAYIFGLAPVQRFLLFIDPLVPLFAGSFPCLPARSSCLRESPPVIPAAT